MNPTLRCFASNPAVLVLAVILSSGPVVAQEGSFTGGFTLGLRSVDIGGAERKYREDFNLEDGPRLFDLHFELVPEGSQRRFADQVVLSASQLGGDPFETVSLSIRKYGDYKLTYRRTKSDYFYEDIILPAALADLDRSNVGDLHHFDFDRVRETADLEVRLNTRARLDLGFERFVKRGESTTTLDVSRDEFEMDRPIDESLNVYRGSFSYAWDKATLTLTERVRDYENRYEIFLPGFSLGENPEGASLDFFFLDQPYDFTSVEHTARLALRPMPRLRLDLLGNLQSMDLDVEAAERSQGIAFTGAPLATDLVGAGEIQRDIDQFLAEATFQASERVALVAGVRQQTLDQDGDLAFGGAQHLGSWELDTTAMEAGVEVAVSPTVTVAGGVVHETREVGFDWSVIEGEAEGRSRSEDTDNTGYFATVSWHPVSACDVTLDVESNSFDDPFTLASPTDRERYRLRGRYAWDNGVRLSGGYTRKSYENSSSGWDADTDHATLRLGYSGARFEGSLGWGNVTAERAIDQVVNDDNPFAIFYEADSDFLDGRFRVRAGDRVSLGADLRSYDNDGSFGVARDDLRGWLEIGVLDGYSVRVAYRTIDYDEDEFDFDDYDADILELGLGYSW